jgi:protein gp37
MAHRFSGPGRPYEGLTRATTTGPRWTGEVRLVPDALELPLRWRKPRRVFVDSMSDLFHSSVPADFIAEAFQVMQHAGQHTFIVLTKRAERLCELVEVPANVWIGVSVEDQAAADERIPHLLAALGRHKFLSCEPLLGPVDLARIRIPDAPSPPCTGHALHAYRGFLRRVDWVIVGGESGPGARPMHPQWARSIRDQCGEAGVKFFFKQWGEWAPCVDDEKFTHCGTETSRTAQTWLKDDGERGCCWIVDGDGTWQNYCGAPGTDMSRIAIMNRWGKARAGRLLDGREWNETPEPTR